MNVAFGGSLHQRVHEVAGFQDHREPDVEDLDVMYGPAHEVRFEPGGYLQAITGMGGAEVNSLHHQGVDRLADELVVEALASDGLVEAFRVRNAPGFTLGVQWHPEWKVMGNPVSLAIFQAFGDACRDYRKDNATLARTGVAD